MTIKVLIVDDSAVVRQVLERMLNADNTIQVLDKVSDPIFAMKSMEKEWPDVIILDIEMPRMDGLTFLKEIMKKRPTPVIMCSTLTEKGAKATMTALADGAVNIVTKPQTGLKDFLESSENNIVQAVKAAARANVANINKHRTINKPKPSATKSSFVKQSSKALIAIGASTGGTQAIERILRNLTATCPGVVIVQHMPEKFTALFAERLDGLCEVEVLEAKHRDVIKPGRVLIAPGGKHMRVKKMPIGFCVEVFDGPPVNRHKPAVDVLFRSVSQFVGADAVGIILTGMGDDGARGLLAMKQTGADTYAQDEESCVVYGMPKEAVQLDAAKKLLPLDAFAALIESYR